MTYTENSGSLSPITLRVARPDDAKALLAIYAPYVENTAITYEYDVPTEEEFRARIDHTLQKFPYLVAEQNGEPVGYAYLSAFHPRAAYAWCAETSVYIRQDARRLGLGRRFYEALEKIARAQGVAHLVALVATNEQPDEHLDANSLHFHEHMGYRVMGVFDHCGYKFGRWYGMTWLTKQISNEEQPSPIVPFSEMKGSILEELGIRR